MWNCFAHLTKRAVGLALLPDHEVAHRLDHIDGAHVAEPSISMERSTVARSWLSKMSRTFASPLHGAPVPQKCYDGCDNGAFVEMEAESAHARHLHVTTALVMIWVETWTLEALTKSRPSRAAVLHFAVFFFYAAKCLCRSCSREASPTDCHCWQGSVTVPRLGANREEYVFPTEAGGRGMHHVPVPGAYGQPMAANSGILALHGRA